MAHLIQRTFEVNYHTNYLAVRLHGMGLSPQQPRTRAKQRDDALVDAWLKRDLELPRIGGSPALCVDPVLRVG